MRLLAIGLALASIATAMSAFASSLYLVAALRLLVGVGQSVLVPAAYSLLGDIVPRERIGRAVAGRSEEHTHELQSLMRISYAVFCLNKKTSPYELLTLYHPLSNT